MAKKKPLLSVENEAQKEALRAAFHATVIAYRERLVARALVAETSEKKAAREKSAAEWEQTIPPVRDPHGRPLKNFADIPRGAWLRETVMGMQIDRAKLEREAARRLKGTQKTRERAAARHEAIRCEFLAVRKQNPTIKKLGWIQARTRENLKKKRGKQRLLVSARTVRKVCSEITGKG